MYTLNLIYLFSALKIHVSSDTKAALDYFGNFILIPRGEIDVKVSVHELMRMYLLIELINLINTFIGIM